MNVKEFWFNSLVAAFGTIASAWFGGWDIALNVLVYLMIFDYITGFLGAIKQKKVNSEVMFWGGIRKCVILSVVALAVLFDVWFGNSNPIFRTLAIYYYSGREGVSVTENLGILGVWLPPKLKTVLEQLQGKGE